MRNKIWILRKLFVSLNKIRRYGVINSDIHLNSSGMDI